MTHEHNPEVLRLCEELSSARERWSLCHTQLRQAEAEVLALREVVAEYERDNNKNIQTIVDLHAQLGEEPLLKTSAEIELVDLREELRCTRDSLLWAAEENKRMQATIASALKIADGAPGPNLKRIAMVLRGKVLR